MRKFLIALIFITGCSGVPEEARNQANDNSLICDAFVVLIQKGRTTREQEQAFIRANRRAWHAQNYALNDVPLPPDIAPVSTRTP